MAQATIRQGPDVCQTSWLIPVEVYFSTSQVSGDRTKLLKFVYFNQHGF